MSKRQQVHFFRDCLLPQQGLAYDSLDVEALVDGELTTGENWKENIRPKAVKLVEDRYEGYDQEKVEAELEKIEHLRKKFREREGYYD